MTISMTTPSIMTFSIITLSITIKNYDNQLNGISDVMLSVIIRSVTYVECPKEDHYAECHHAECHFAERHYAEHHYAECHGTNNLEFHPVSLSLSLLKLFSEFWS